MKVKVLSLLVPALLVAGAANAAEIYNKDGNKLDYPNCTAAFLLWNMSARLRWNTKNAAANKHLDLPLAGRFNLYHSQSSLS